MLSRIFEFSKIGRFQIEGEFSQKNVNSDTAKKVAEEICEQHPEFKACLKTIRFVPIYFMVFLSNVKGGCGQGSAPRRFYRKTAGGKTAFAVAVTVTVLEFLAVRFCGKDFWNWR